MCARLVVFIALVATLPDLGVRVSGTGQAQQEAREPFTLGVLRADGILVPFASFDGDDWKRGWPADLGGRDLPATLDAVPRGWWGGAPPAAWQVWKPEGKEPEPFKTLSLITFDIGQFRRLGIRTDRKPVPVDGPPFQVPYPKLGLAVSGNVRLEPIVTVSRLGSAWRDLLAGIGPALARAEEQTISGLRVNAQWNHPVHKQDRARVAPELEAWYTSELPAREGHVSYIEAVKKYPPQPRDEGCGLETVITGWILQKPNDKPKPTLKAVVTYCDRERTSYMLPFGRIVAGNRAHWVFQMSGRDHEWYAVAEVTPGRVRYVAEYHGGGFLR
jgi:hypothetical protein